MSLEMVHLVFWLLIGGVFSLGGGILLLLFKTKTSKIVLELTSFAAGVLMVVAILDLIPEGIEHGELDVAVWLILAGTLFLFFLEQSSLWFHHHHEPHKQRANIFGLWLGDSLHNLMDGVAIGAAYAIEPKVGIATALAVAAHELPQEIADFGLYLRAGFSKKKTIVLNLISSLWTLIGGILTFYVGSQIEGLEPLILSFTGGMFLYIALADLVPELHNERDQKSAIRQTLAFVFGIVIAVFNLKTFGH